MMNHLCRGINISGKVNRLIPRRKASTTVKDQFHQPDTTPEELRLMSERLKIRKALRAEYLRKATDPHSSDPLIFDPAMQRFYSMHMTKTERFIPTFKNWCSYMITSIIPVILLALYFKHDRERLEKKYRSGEIEYKDRLWRIE